MASKPVEVKAIAWRGPLTPAWAADGINAAIRNARRLLNDAKTLYNVRSFPTALALGILAIEEYGKVNIIHRILVAKTDSARKKLWRLYTSHTAKNTPWVVPNLIKAGARSADDFRILFQENAKHQYVLDDFKQWSLYTECRGALWSEPAKDITGEMCLEVLSYAHLLITPLPEFSVERMALYFKYMSPVWVERDEDADTAAIRKALGDFYRECQQRGWMKDGVDPHKFFGAKSAAEVAQQNMENTMTAETAEHLGKTEQTIQRAKQLLGTHGYPDDLRTVVVSGFISQVVEHHESMLLLIRNGKIGSAFALARSIFESMMRGLWIAQCATDKQVEKFERDDEFPVNMTEMSKAIDQRISPGENGEEGFFEDLKNRGWKTMCSYTHTGLLQLGRRFTGHNVEPSYSDQEIFEVTTAVTTCILLLVSVFLRMHGHGSASDQLEGMIGKSYGVAQELKTGT